MPSFDAIVIGAGHNGLTCAAYLARAGRSVLVLEARSVIGGCSGTEEAVGARVNLCNCDHIMVRANPLLSELGLAGHGLDYIEVDPNLGGIGWDDEPPVFIFRDPDRTLAFLRTTYPNQVEGYKRYLQAAMPAARLLMSIINDQPIPSRIMAKVLRGGGRSGRTLWRWKDRSMLEVMGAFISDERLLRPMVATTTAVWGLAPSAERTGYAALSYAVRHLLGVARPAGGSGMLAAALRSCLEESGGVVRCNNKVASIGTAGTGIEVVMADGTRLAAPVVVSAVCPRQTVERLIDTSAMPALTGLKDRMRSVRQVDGYQSKIDAVIESLPRLRALADAGIHSPFTASIAIAPPIDEIETMASLHREGLIAKRPLMLLNIPSVADPSLLAGGRHVMSLEVLFTPYELRGGWNDTVAGGWLDGLSRLAEPGFRDRVREWRVMTPPRYEADLGLTRGNPPAYGGGPFDVLFARKDPLVRYATPLPGLYLSGAGTFPGGGISGAAGRNAALKVLADTS